MLHDHGSTEPAIFRNAFRRLANFGQFHFDGCHVDATRMPQQ
jgi:hypothetical protein